MKYKRLLVFVTSMIFFTALIICFFAMFKTAEISIDVNSVAGSNEQVAEKVQALLQDKEGKNLLFISTEELEREVNGVSSYAKVTKIEKKYPNKLEVYVEERVEKFAVCYQNKYYVVDEEMHVLKEKQENVNNVTGKPNLLINFDIADIDTETLKVGKNLSIYDAKTSAYLKENINSLFEKMGDISTVSITVKKEKFYFRRITLTMREGMVINIDKADIRTSEKIKKAYEFYLAASNKGDKTEYFVNVLEATGDIIVST